MLENDWSLYFLWCQGDRIYTGISNNPERRFAAHRAGLGAKFTRMYPPLSMQIMACHLTKSEASSLEYRYKGLTAQKKQQLWYRQRAFIH